MTMNNVKEISVVELFDSYKVVYGVIIGDLEEEIKHLVPKYYVFDDSNHKCMIYELEKNIAVCVGYTLIGLSALGNEKQRLLEFIKNVK
ncbi:MAG: hypothetical protein ACK5LZ_06195 [Anaerorhabdus sp.]